ncbi:MAG: hypothetical protein KJZ47_08830 [Gemmatimonadales bacterium]|nr:hypothetical protein [Gemmatimonadales bacterium]
MRRARQAGFGANAALLFPLVTGSGSFPAIIPLSLLEAMRNLDTPVEDGLDDLAEELVTKRLGLSSTVAAQIERYRRAAQREERIPGDEVVAVFRLVSRRADADLVYADAGRRTARYAARGVPALRRFLVRLAPKGLRRRLGVASAARVAGRLLNATLRPHGELARVEMRESLATRAAAAGQGCRFYGAAFAELLRVLSGFEGAMVHEGCQARGDSTCRWSASPAEGY